jgi:hypothetical protein
MKISPGAGGQPRCTKNFAIRIGSSGAATKTCSGMSRRRPLTSTSLVNWVRPVASMIPGRWRASAAIDAIRSASIGRSSRMVADAGSVLM